MDNNQIKALSIVFQDDAALAAAYAQHKAQLLVPVYGMTGTALDLNALPKKPFDFKTVFLQWALAANQSRINAGKEPLFTMGLVLACPLWKIVPPPFVSISMTKESLMKLVGRTKPVIGTALGGALKRSNGNIR